MPLLALALVVLVAGVALAGATLNALYRDVAYVVTTGLMFLFWLTPIVYPPETIGEPYRTVLAYNPFAAILQALRGAVLEGVWPGAVAWLAIAGGSLGVLAFGWALFRKLEPAMLDHV